MLIAGFPAGAWGTNCYLVAPAAGEECVIIDPGHQAAEGVEEALKKHRLKPVAVVLTHGHIDHVASVVPVCGAHDVPAWIHPEDRYMMNDPSMGLGRSIGMPLMGEITVGGQDPEEAVEAVMLVTMPQWCHKAIAERALRVFWRRCSDVRLDLGVRRTAA